MYGIRLRNSSSSSGGILIPPQRVQWFYMRKCVHGCICVAQLYFCLRVWANFALRPASYVVRTRPSTRCRGSTVSGQLRSSITRDVGCDVVGGSNSFSCVAVGSPNNFISLF